MFNTYFLIDVLESLYYSSLQIEGVLKTRFAISHEIVFLSFKLYLNLQKQYKKKGWHF